MVHCFLEGQYAQTHKLTVSAVTKIFGVSWSGYYAYLDRLEDRDGRQRTKQKELERLMEMIRSVIHKCGFVPGKRTISLYLFRDFGIRVGNKKVARLMHSMNLVANKPVKDAYKNQATHNHEITAPDNIVGRDFYKGPRRVVLTDITYLYYGPERVTIFLCAFKDAFTREILGYSVDDTMTVSLIQSAYDMMMKRHRGEFHFGKAACYVHSDQGSQYLSTTFRQLLKDDDFVQSVSNRGNSQDNAPMESFFGTMKTRILNLVALCQDQGTAAALICDYIEKYNSEFYQYTLAGLTPEEFYIYSTTGIYPLKEHFDQHFKDLDSPEKIIAYRRAEAEKANSKARAAAARKREAHKAMQSEENPGTTVLRLVSRDKSTVDRIIRQWEKTSLTASKQLEFLNGIQEHIKQAMAFVVNAAGDVIVRLADPDTRKDEWSRHPELAYVYEMDHMK